MTSSAINQCIKICSKKLLRENSKLTLSFTRQSATALQFDLSLPTEDFTDGQLFETNRIKSWFEIPTPKGLPILGTLIYGIRHGILTRLHEYCDNRFKELGSIYREKIGTLNAVFLSDPVDVERVYRQDEKHPQHLIPDPMQLYTEITGKPRGLFFMDGDHWNSRRTFLNSSVISHPKRYNRFSHRLNEVTEDLIKRWKNIRKNNVIEDLDKEIYNWSIESLGGVLFETRLGCLHEERQSLEVQEFVQAVRTVFHETMTMLMVPARMAKLFNLPTWTRFLTSMDKSIEIVNKMVLKRIEELVDRIEAGEDVGSMFLNEMLSNKDLKTWEIIRIITDLFSAASDTTSQAISWALYLLAKHPESQKMILQELESIVKPGEDLQPKHIQEMSYLKGVLRETLRLYPITPFLTRIMRRDITLKGYSIPANTVIMISLYTMGRDPNIYSDPESFKPERWLKSEERQNYITRHASLPFGHARRSCVGRRLAEYKMQLLLAKLVKEFEIEPANDKEVGIKLRLITAPSEPIRLKFKEHIVK